MAVTVFYDDQCPLCIREVNKWRRAPFRKSVKWFDITNQDEALSEQGIDPVKALLELHLKTEDGRILTSIASYSYLLKQLPRWCWLGYLMGLPVVQPILKWNYDWMTRVRLKHEGRLPGTSCTTSRCQPKK